MKRVASIAGVAAALTLAVALPAGATSGPVGPLPPGQVTSVVAPRGSLVSVVLPKGAQGRAWRQAGTVDTSVLKQVSEANVGPNVVVVFKAVGSGSTKVAYGLTRGETPKAYASVTYKVTVR
jgi:hypothetical protein